MKRLNERLQGVGPLFLEGGEVGADEAERFKTLRGAEAAGDFHLDLGHAHIALGKIVGERNAVIRREPPDIVGIENQPIQEVSTLALLGFAPLTGRGSFRIGRRSFGEDFIVTRTVVGDSIFRQNAVQ